MENSYVEVKVGFIHIVILLVGVILIGSFLFYLGYQSGKSAARNDLLQSDVIKSPDSAEEINLDDQPDTQPKQQQAKNKKPSISEEIKLHQIPSDKNKRRSEVKDTIKAKPIKKESYWSIQVGAFSDYSNAKKYAATFQESGYPTEINTIMRNNQKLHRVRVGNFKSRAAAQKEMVKLQKKENKRFALVSPD